MEKIPLDLSFLIFLKKDKILSVKRVESGQQQLTLEKKGSYCSSLEDLRFRHRTQCHRITCIRNTHTNEARNYSENGWVKCILILQGQSDKEGITSVRLGGDV